MRRAGVVAMALAACGSSAPADPPAPPPAPAAVPPAAAAFAAKLSPDVVGTLAPGGPVVGDYAMSLHVTAERFETTELRVSDTVDGAMRLALAGDGSARTCVGVRAVGIVDGQRDYRRDHDNDHRRVEVANFVAMTGTWTATDGVATIRFDHLAWSTCSPAAATPLESPIELQCIAGGPAPSRLPANSLVCEVTSKMQIGVSGLGMPMTTASRQPGVAPTVREMPRGSELVLAPLRGVAVTVAQDRNATVPTFTFAPQAAPFDEAAFRPTR